ncbi:hypothetical protein NIES4072_31220 [Nostoc commune NIES-4072]|uniref:Uncharacterized protein n=1 Tax=Nostoc commune NIES-4072 TaxID=2005467 RepID=A0A2R5FUU4_NOSCO|nr:hypothetical protein [Nostoc commune]BBD69545.1 hypothetical protein NIES4070_59540 [Nostoc commune HK-02]GBG19454.1 hypothetical protein NIES4072_31220 [Nostoc commune NIES-4072]
MTSRIVELTKKSVFWRFDGDPVNFDISDSDLRIFIKTIWVDSNDEIYQSDINWNPITQSVQNLNLVPEFQSIILKLQPLIISYAANALSEDETMLEGLSRRIRIWRYQGEVFSGLAEQTQIDICLQKVLVGDDGSIYDRQDLYPFISGNIIDLNLLTEFQSIQVKLNTLLNSEVQTKILELEPTVQLWRYQGVDTPSGDIATAPLELFFKKGLRDTSTGYLYKVEDLPTISGTPEELGLLPEFQNLQTKIQAITTGLA